MSPLQRRFGFRALARSAVLLGLCGCNSAESDPADGNAGPSDVTGGAPSSGGASSVGAGGSGSGNPGSGGELGGTGGRLANGSGGETNGDGGSPASGGEGSGAGGEGVLGATGGESNISERLCEQSVTDANKAIAEEAMRRLFIETDASAFTEFWADPYLQHNPVAGSGVDAFWGFFEGQVASGNPLYSMERYIGECDLVLFHGSWGTGAMFDMMRVENGKLIEHWDAPSSGLGGMATEGEPLLSEQSRQLVLEFTDQLIENDPTAASAYLGASFTSHNGQINGSADFVSWWEGRGVTYTEVHHVVADGEMVFTMTEGTDGGQGHGFYDLYRVVGGEITEHWDGGRQMEDGASGLGIF